MNARTLESGRSLRPLVLAVALLAALIGCRIVTYGVRLTSLSVAPSTDTIAATTTRQFTATGTYNDDSARDVTAEVAWSSSDPTVATVDAGGLATPASAGLTTITASLGGESASATLTVTNAQLQTITVTPAAPSIPNGTRLQFTATGHFDDASSQDLTNQVTWTSSSPSVTIGDTAGSKGLAASTALGAGTSTITATFQAISGFATLTVNALTLDSVSVTPSVATVTVGLTRPFTATGTFSDLSTHDMTREVTWASSDTSIATVTASGSARGVFAGTATITATSSALLGSVAGTAQLTVQSSGGGY